MLINKVKILKSHGWQFIPKLPEVNLPEIFHGMPEISGSVDYQTAIKLSKLCPSGAISTDSGLSIDLGRCVFCNECAFAAPDNIRFTNSFRMASPTREGLVISAENSGKQADFSPEVVRSEIRKYFKGALKLRHVCAGGDCSTEMELNASMNVNFDFSRYGIDFVASPRHADGIVISGPITANMAQALEVCFDAVARPKLIILAGTDAISGGVLAGSPAIDRSFLNHHRPDLYIPGNPVHPLAFIDGVMKLVNRKFNR